MIDLFAAIALVLLIAGVAGSFIPMAPGAVFSLAGVTVYWWSTGFTEPGIFAVVLLYLTALTALFFDLFAGAIGSKAGGASSKTVHMAAIAGLVFFFIGGPLGTIIGIAAVVYLREYLLTGESRGSLKAALYTVISTLGSAIVQGIMTGITLALFLATLIF